MRGRGLGKGKVKGYEREEGDGKEGRVKGRGVCSMKRSG